MAAPELSELSEDWRNYLAPTSHDSVDRYVTVTLLANRCRLGCAPGRLPQCRDNGGGSMGSALVMV